MTEDDYQKLLESYGKERKIFIDTCSLLHPGIHTVFKNLFPYLKRYDNKIIIALATYRELEKHANANDNAALRRSSQLRLTMIDGLRTSGLVELRGEKTEHFADPVFLHVFTKFRLTHKLLLITQDKNLAGDIKALNAIKSSKPRHPIIVNRINDASYYLEDID